MIRPNQLAIGYGAAMAAGVAGLGFTPAAFAIPSLAMMALLADGIFRPASSVLMATVTHGPRTGNRVALTFDDGPDARVTPRILDALEQHNASATFYCIGRYSEAHPALMARIVSAGHELGNHSHAHARTLNFRGARFQQQEIERANALIRRFAPRQKVITYRPPVGLKNPPLAKAIDRLNMPVVAWSLHSRDTRIPDAEAVSHRVLARIRPGDIVVMHDGHDLAGRSRSATAEAVAMILAGLKDKGLESVTVGQLINAG